jgi:hypothetical protein
MTHSIAREKKSCRLPRGKNPEKFQHNYYFGGKKFGIFLTLFQCFPPFAKYKHPLDWPSKLTSLFFLIREGKAETGERKRRRGEGERREEGNERKQAEQKDGKGFRGGVKKIPKIFTTF